MSATGLPSSASSAVSKPPKGRLPSFAWQRRVADGRQALRGVDGAFQPVGDRAIGFGSFEGEPRITLLP